MTYLQRGKKILFEDKIVRQLLEELCHKTSAAVGGGEDQLDRDMTEHEWALQYVDSKKKGILLVSQLIGRGKLAQDCLFSYYRILRLHYKDPDSQI